MLEMQQLKNTISKLKEVLPAGKAKHAITVMNKDNLQKVIYNMTGDQLAETYGSIEEFFEFLHANEINNVRIYDRKQNGSGFKAVGEYDCNFKTKETADNVNQAPANLPQVQPVQPQVMHQPIALNGAIGGLGFDQVFKLGDHARLEREHNELKAEYKVLKEHHERLKEENLRNDLLGTKSVEKASANNDLVEKLMPLAMALGQKFLGPSSGAPGLNGATLSPIRQQFVGIAQNADENLLNDLSIVIQGMQSPEFDDELTELCKKHKLISD